MSDIVVKSNLLKDLYPQLFKLLHPEKNEGVDFDKITIGCNKKFYWICPKCPELFYSIVKSRIPSLQSNKKKCIHGSPKVTEEIFFQRALEKHQDKFDYSETKFISLKGMIIVTCKKCLTRVEISSYNHLYYNCKTCSYQIGSSKRIKTTEQFILESKKFHGENAYNYEFVVYEKSRINVHLFCNTCKEHIFQTPENNLKNSCNNCAIRKPHLLARKNTEHFIKRALDVHPEGRYDYSRVKYELSKIRVEILCVVCNLRPFFQLPWQHYAGYGCPACAIKNLILLNTKTTEYFIEKANKIFEGLYDYSQTKYESYKLPLKILCPNCGPFYQFPQAHYAGYGCPICSYKHLTRTTEDFIKKSVDRFGVGRFDYNLTKYISYKSFVTIKCVKCFTMINVLTTNHYRSKYGCYRCAIEGQKLSMRKSTKQFIEEAIAIYGTQKFDFSRTEYINSNMKIIIGCKCGNWFEQTPSNFLSGNKGCVTCRKRHESKGANNCRNYLLENNIDFKCEMKFKPYNYRYDFVFEYNDTKICLEFDGAQHFEFVEYFHKTEEEFERRKQIDIKKNVIAKDNDHVVIRISNNKSEHISNYLINILENIKDDKYLYVDDEFKYQHMF